MLAALIFAIAYAFRTTQVPQDQNSSPAVQPHYHVPATQQPQYAHTYGALQLQDKNQQQPVDQRYSSQGYAGQTDQRYSTQGYHSSNSVGNYNSFEAQNTPPEGVYNLDVGSHHPQPSYNLDGADSKYSNLNTWESARDSGIGSGYISSTSNI